MKKNSTFVQLWKAGDRKKRGVIALALLVCLALSVLRIFLAWRAPYVFQTMADHDDALQVKLAYHLMQHQWLGEYDQLTLSKGISFPVFLTILNRISIPYGMGLGCFMVVTSALCLAAFRPVLENPWLRLCGYVALLYNPLGFSNHLALRVYRSSLTPWACLLVIASFAAIFLRRREPVRHLIFWSLLGTISLPFFWYLREDSVWLAPFIILAPVITLLIWVFSIRRRGIALLVSALLLVLPFAGLFAVKKAQEKKNAAFYQIAVVNDRSATNYAEVMSLLHHIDDGTGRMDSVREQDQEWVSRETMKQAVAVSPTLYSIRKEIRTYWYAWAGDNGRIEGDIGSWMLRDAVAAAGYYTDGATADAFYGKVVQELQQAFQDGKLKERKAIYLSSQAKGFQKKDFLECIPLTFQTFGEDALWAYCEERPTVTEGTPEQIQLWERVMRTSTVVSDSVLQTIKADPEQAEYAAQREDLNRVITKREQKISAFANAVTAIWKVLSIPLLVLAAAGYVFSVIAMHREKRRDTDKRWFSLWLIMTGILLSALLDIYAVCLFSRWIVGGFTGILSYYGNVAYTLIVLLEILGTGSCILATRERRENKRHSDFKETTTDQGNCLEGAAGK